MVYIRAGETSANQVLNLAWQDMDPHYREFVRSLGWSRGFSANDNTVYWADASSEITFVVPNDRYQHNPDIKVVVVWLESFEDHLSVPLGMFSIFIVC